MSLAIFLVPLLLARNVYTTRKEGPITGQSCRCVPMNLCSDDDVAVNGDGLLDIRYKDDECENYFEVCCENPMERLEGAPEVSAFKGCGVQNPIPMAARITSDSQTADFGELPWTAIVLERDVARTERNMYKCGGSLVHPRVVVTAAHCVVGSDQGHLTVRVGEWNTKSTSEPIPHQDHGVSEIVTHPHYRAGSLKNDIALLFLTENVILADNIGLICLPPPNFKTESAICTASGWGRDAFNKGRHSSALKKIDLPLVDRERCLQALRRTRLGMFYNLHRSFICAGGEENRDTCKGDGGSPLVCPIPGVEGRYFLMGIVSWGIGCGENETPGVYVNVPLFSMWIDKQIGGRDLDTTVYKY